MDCTNLLNWIRECKEYLAKINNLPKYHGAGPHAAASALGQPCMQMIPICLFHNQVHFLCKVLLIMNYLKYIYKLCKVNVSFDRKEGTK